MTGLKGGCQAKKKVRWVLWNPRRPQQPLLSVGSLWRVARASSSLLRMMVCVGVWAGARDGGVPVFLPSGLCSRWMWNLRCPFRLKLREKESGSFRCAAPLHLCPAARGPGLMPHRCPQRWQAKGFSLVWVNICRRRSFLFLDAKLHWPHWWGRRLACSAMCAWKGLRQVHYSPRPSTHTMHMNAHRLQEGQHLPGPLATGRH